MLSDYKNKLLPESERQNKREGEAEDALSAMQETPAEEEQGEGGAGQQKKAVDADRGLLPEVRSIDEGDPDDTEDDGGEEG